MEVNEIEVIIVSAEKEDGNKQDCIVIPEAGERTTDFLEYAVGKFVTDYLFDSRGKDIVTVKWGHVFKIEE